MVFEEPTDMMFSFNNPLGACPTCEGFGKVLGIDENLVVPDKSLSVFQGAVVCWKGDVMGEWLKEFIVKSEKYNFPIHRPYYDLTQRRKTCFGTVPADCTASMTFLNLWKRTCIRYSTV